MSLRAVELADRGIRTLTGALRDDQFDGWLSAPPSVNGHITRKWWQLAGIHFVDR
jgi:hypothetical protein